jgi:hypothetical protein
MEQSAKPLPQKKEYAHPVLTEHGTLARLTHSGTGTVSEAGQINQFRIKT